MKCEWFLLCENPATTTVAHPILGEVPCCARCVGKAVGAALDEAYPWGYQSEDTEP